MHLLGVQLLLVLSVVGWSLVTVILGWFGLRVRVFTDFCLFVGCGNLMRKLQDRAVFSVSEISTCFFLFLGFGARRDS